MRGTADSRRWVNEISCGMIAASCEAISDRPFSSSGTPAHGIRDHLKAMNTGLNRTDLLIDKFILL
jgi:hypothetical protein